MVKRERECNGGDHQKTHVKTLEECAANCKDYKTFIYAFLENRRNDDGYRCYCETSSGEVCTDVEHKSYNLYRFT